jgi:hypothetical protein
VTRALSGFKTLRKTWSIGGQAWSRTPPYRCDGASHELLLCCARFQRPPQHLSGMTLRILDMQVQLVLAMSAEQELRLSQVLCDSAWELKAAWTHVPGRSGRSRKCRTRSADFMPAANIHTQRAPVLGFSLNGIQLGP